ncbi:putative periplasmic or exported protein [Yersinia frederiksenii]|nr:putative periplasmic or exported protein [Yersinia frederiksenii]
MHDMLCYNKSAVVKRLTALLLAGGVLIYSQLAHAHPHSFIDMDATFVSEKQAVVGIKMVWTMDEITSADLLYDAENAKSDSEIWKKLAAEVMANVLGQHYFTDIYRDGKPVKYKNLPTEYHLSRKGHQAVLEFVLPLAEPQPLVGKPFIISTYDPTYFVDMTYAGEKAVRLSPEMEKSCKLTLFTPNPNASLQAYALSLDKSDSPGEDMELGKQFAQRVTVQCQ